MPCRPPPHRLPGRNPASRLQALVHAYEHMKIPLRHFPHRGRNVSSSQTCASTPPSSPLDGTPRLASLGSLSRPQSTAPSCSALRSTDFAPSDRRAQAEVSPVTDLPGAVSNLGLGCSSAIRFSDCAGKRLGVYVAVTRRCILPAARGARAAWSLDRRDAPAACGLCYT